jgi:hypothetical protein
VDGLSRALLDDPLGDTKQAGTDAQASCGGRSAVDFKLNSIIAQDETNDSAILQKVFGFANGQNSGAF